MALLYPSSQHPYYVVTPPYEKTSAGIRCLHLLCHCLNTKGQTAYLVPEPVAFDSGLENVVGTDLLTPYLTEATANEHARLSKTPIVIYPETVAGNPYAADCVVRYVLNFPGLLGGDKVYQAGELCFGYSKALAAATDFPDNVLFIPPVDTRIFKKPSKDTIRIGGCFYADKYRKIHGGIPYSITENCIEIVRQQEGAQTTEEVAAILQKSEVFYTYENTALAIEAVLCGCPAVFIPNPYLTKIIASMELGMDGYAWGTDEQDIARAKATVGGGTRRYLDLIDEFWLQLENFVEVTQAHARHTEPKLSFCFPRREAQMVSAVSTGSKEGTDGLENIQTEVMLYSSLVQTFMLGIFRFLPTILEREVGKFLSTVGLKKAGAIVWNSSYNRSGFKVSVITTKNLVGAFDKIVED